LGKGKKGLGKWRKNRELYRLMQPLEVHIEGERLLLLPERALYWPAQRALILADLHLGKVSHFRRHGFHLPEAPSHTNFRRLRALLDAFSPACVYFLGDLFHSHHNQELDTLGEICQEYPSVVFHLIKGNHDILPEARYHNMGLQVHPEPFDCAPFVFVHHPREVADGAFYLAGHLHPGVMLSGWGRQKVKLACFLHQPYQLILPAFGEFTGLAIQPVTHADRVYVIAEEEVVAFT